MSLMGSECGEHCEGQQRGPAPGDCCPCGLALHPAVHRPSVHLHSHVTIVIIDRIQATFRGFVECMGLNFKIQTFKIAKFFFYKSDQSVLTEMWRA